LKTFVGKLYRAREKDSRKEMGQF